MATYKWKFPPAARKAHLFADDSVRSMCGGWLFNGPPCANSDFKPDAKDGPDDCRPCAKAARKEIQMAEAIKAQTEIKE